MGGNSHRRPTSKDFPLGAKSLPCPQLEIGSATLDRNWRVQGPA